MMKNNKKLLIFQNMAQSVIKKLDKINKHKPKLIAKTMMLKNKINRQNLYNSKEKNME